ncbi:MAG: flagellar basal body P-ring formation protein FlgA [Proteobacteria bacterium]|nr:flagellar basal body P-ring formation protein FlgA [Pseudomonadota bacterium]
MKSALLRFIPALALPVLLMATPTASARQDPAPVRAEVARFLNIQSRSLPGEVSIQVGDFATDNVLPPCVQLEAFLPPGSRQWGRLTVGVRCLAPSAWSAYVPAEVRVRGVYLVTATPLTAGQIVGPDDLRREIGELSTQATDVLTDPSQAVGHAARISLAAGKPLAASNLRLPPAVVQGQPVKVISRGPGFQVANDGTALSTASDGQGAQVRLSTGQVVRGVARNGGFVEIITP